VEKEILHKIFLTCPTSWLKNARFRDEIVNMSRLMTFISHQNFYPQVFTRAPAAADLAKAQRVNAELRLQISC
jgi:ribosomal protein L18